MDSPSSPFSSLGPLCKRVVLHYANPCFVFEHVGNLVPTRVWRERESRHKRKEGRGGKRQFPMIICYALEDEARTGSRAPNAPPRSTFLCGFRPSTLRSFSPLLAISWRDGRLTNRAKFLHSASRAAFLPWCSRQRPRFPHNGACEWAP